MLLSPGEDYTITYENNCNAGTAAAIIQAENGKKWTGSVLVPFSILKASPIVAVVLSPEGDYTAGDAVPEITLTENSTPGSVSWSAGMPSRLTEGEQTLSWDYIPSDAQNYEAVSGTRVLYAKPIATTTTTPVTTVTTTTTTTTDPDAPVTTAGYHSFCYAEHNTVCYFHYRNREYADYHNIGFLYRNNNDNPPDTSHTA